MTTTDDMQEPHEPKDAPPAEGVANPEPTAGEPAADTKPDLSTSSTAVGAYSVRELHFVSREAAGALSFNYVVNDGSPQNLIWLTSLKNIISKQLPNMPKEYIARLVFERRHRSVAIVAADGTVMGGITYRTFPGGPAATLGEIAFCAVSANHQVKGFGTRLMNWTKEHARTRDGLSHFLTYADNNAVGYFAKQGFTKEVTLPRERWAGAIKDYDGGTLMEFVIHPRINYSALPQMVRAQRSALEEHLKKISNSHVVHAPLCRPGEPFKPVLPHDIPGVAEAGYKGPPTPPYKLALSGSVVPATPEAQHTFMANIVALLRAQKDQIWPFEEPVDAEQVPDYHTIVRDPIDLGTVQQRVESRSFYATLDMFLADVRRIWSNARLYNQEDTVYYKFANQLEDLVNQHVRMAVHLDG